jgi:HlyD family secretion protein
MTKNEEEKDHSKKKNKKEKEKERLLRAQGEYEPNPTSNELSEPETRSIAKKKGSKKTLWIILGAVLIVVIIVVLYLANQAKKASALTYQTEPITKGQLVAVVGATGTVRSNQTAELIWQTSGRIEKINFQVGDQVAAGETMANLAATTLPQTVILASADLVNAQQSLDDLKDSTTSLSNAELNLAQAQRAYNSALSSYLQKNTAQGTADLITVTEAKLQIMDNNIVDMQKNYDNMAELPNNDSKKALALQNLTQAQIDRGNMKKLLDYYKALPNSLDVDILKGKLDVAKSNLDEAQRQYDQVKTGVNQNDLIAAEAKVNADQATVNMGSIAAPFSGTVTELDSMVGDLVNAGTVSFRIDDLSELLVDVEIPEADINSIKVGQTASLTFDAIANGQYSGKVIQVAHVGDTIAGVVNFKVTLQLLNPDAQVLPGMTAAVNVTVTNLDGVLTVPNRAVRTENNQLVIYVLRNGQVVRVPIVLGAASDTSSEIASGDVQVGDQVILNPPSSLISLMQSSAGSGPVGK